MMIKDFLWMLEGLLLRTSTFCQIIRASIIFATTNIRNFRSRALSINNFRDYVLCVRRQNARVRVCSCILVFATMYICDFPNRSFD